MDLPPDALRVSANGRAATLDLKQVEVIDQPRWPAPDAEARPALLDITLTFVATDEPIEIDDPSRQFRFHGFKAQSQLEARVLVPSIGFSWRSDPISTSRADFAIIGEEANGKYYGK